MTDEDIAKLMVNPKTGHTYGTSYIADNLAAHGCNETIVAYLHKVNADHNRADHDRFMILQTLKDADPAAYERELKASFERNNPKGETVQ